MRPDTTRRLTNACSTLGAAAIALVVAGVGGCGDGDGGSVAARLRACDLLSEGAAPRLPLYAPDECYRSCLSRASCEELEEALCESSIVLLRRCDERCAFRCGDGSLIAVEQVCDGAEQCEDASDELGCTVTESCPDGTPLDAADRCDGRRDCSDASDEEGCPELTCADGTSYPMHGRCDGAQHCGDRSDERGCAELTLTCGAAGS